MTRALFALSLLLAPACKKTPPEPMAAPVEEAPASEVVEQGSPGLVVPAWVSEVPPGEPTVRLIDAGTAPFSELRFHPAPGTSETMRMDMLMSMSMEMAGMRMPMISMPLMTIDMDMTVTEVEPNGNIHYDAVVVGVEVGESQDLPEDAVTQLRDSLATMVGMNGEVVIDDRGRSISANFEVPEGAAPEVAQQVQSVNQQASNLSLPMPAEAVGVGASWQVLQLTEAQGMKVAQRTTVKLASKEGDRLQVESTVEQALADANPQLPDMPPGADVQITEFRSNGTGTTATDLTKLVPTAGTAAVNLVMSMDISEGGNPPMSMSMAMDMSVDIKPRD